MRARAVRLFSSIYALAVHLCSAVRMHTTRSFSFEIAAAIVAFFITAARPGGDGWTDYQTGICCLSPQNVITRILWAVV